MKNIIFVFMIILTIGLILSACTPSGIIPPATETIPRVTEKPNSFPLSEPGPYFVSKREQTIVDESRNDRQIQLTIWYPALKQTDGDGRTITINAEPDLSGAPYPLILTVMNSGYHIFRSHLASHGFVIAHIEFPFINKWDFQTVDWPMDFLFALNQIASNPPSGLVGVIDDTHTGVVGYSFGGQLSLALSGARIDPSYYLSFCEQMPTMQPAYEAWYISLACDLAKKWDAFAVHVGDEITTSDDGLWQPMTDERIRAVMPMGADGAWLFGEQGLAAADRPVLLIQAAKDSPYQPTEAAFIFEYIGTPERSMISFIGKSHIGMLEGSSKDRMQHFATAYFGFHLQGREDYAYFFSEDFVSHFDDLYWGVYQNE